LKQEGIMKLFTAVFGLAALCAVGVTAQSSETRTTSKVTIKDGTPVKVTGCVKAAPGGTGFVLTDVADKNGALRSYMLVSDRADLSKHVGHRVELSGKATDRGDAKITTETKQKTEVGGGDDKESRTKTEVKGDAPGIPYLGVTSIKNIAASCP
jgi:hypothetical protein